MGIDQVQIVRLLTAPNSGVNLIISLSIRLPEIEYDLKDTSKAISREMRIVWEYHPDIR